MANIYEAPGANLSENTVPFEGGSSVEDGIAGNYDFSIGGILGEAWEKTSGSKGTVWLAVLLYGVTIAVVSFAVDFVLGKFGLHRFQPHSGDTIQSAISFAAASTLLKVWIMAPLLAGWWMLSVKLAVRAPTQATDIFSYFSKMLPLVGTMLLFYLMIIIGTCFFVLPGIYLSIAYTLALPLVVEKNLSPWQALEASRKAVTHHWFGVFGLYIVMGLIIMLSTIPLFIGLIWTIPMMALTSGILYRNVFGYQGAVQAE